MSEVTVSSQDRTLVIVADLVAAYVSNNSLPISELPALIQNVHGVLARLTSGSQEITAETVEKPTPAQIRKSITQEALISFEDGKSYKTLRRHLTTRGLSAEAYRTKYGLPTDYPMTAPGYSAMRSELARSLGLGQQRRSAPEAAAKATANDETVSEAPKARRGRPKSTAAEAPKARGRKKAAQAVAAE